MPIKDAVASKRPRARRKRESTIVVVTDDRVVEAAVRALVEEEGHRAVCAATWVEGRELLSRLRPCLLLVDTTSVDALDHEARCPVVTIPIRIERGLGKRSILRRPVRLDLLRETLREHCPSTLPS